MSGYRNLHREQVLFGEVETTITTGGDNGDDGNDQASTTNTNTNTAIWSLCTTPIFSDIITQSTSTRTTLPTSTTSSSTTRNPNWRVWMACSDGLIRGYRIIEKNNEELKKKTKIVSKTAKDTEDDGSAVDKDDGDTKEKEEVEELSASAVQLQFTHILSSSSSSSSSSLSSTISGCTALSSVVINAPYKDNKSNISSSMSMHLVMVLAAMDMTGILRIWTIPIILDNDNSDDDDDDDDDDRSNKPKSIPSSININLSNATGTTALFVPPPPVTIKPMTTSTTTVDDDDDENDNVLLVAVGCIDGTIVFVSTGISLFKNDFSESSSSASEAGTIVQVWGNDNNNNNSSINQEEKETSIELAVPLVLAWQPTTTTITSRRGHRYRRTLAVGRFDGHVDVYTSSSSSLSSPKCSSRLDALFGSPTRAVTFTTDGHLLIAGNDHGHLCLWDCSRSCSSLQSSVSPVLVHHFHQAHSGWILNVTAIHERSFLSLGTDNRIKVWNVGQMDHGHAIHVFSSFFNTNTTNTNTATTTTAATSNNNNNNKKKDVNPAETSTTTTRVEEEKDKKMSLLLLPPLPPQPLPMLWSMARGPSTTARFITGSDHGWLQIYSLE